MTRSNIIAFFHRAGWGVNAVENDEIQTNCPECGYGNFYFNLSKLVGFCHKAKCKYHYTPPTLEDLEERVGFGPNDFGGYRIDRSGVDEDYPPRNFPTVELPGVPVIEMIGGIPHTRYPAVVDYLRNRHLSQQDIIRFKLSYDGTRVYVPVYQGENLVNYVGRDLTNKEKKKYLYSPGAKTSEWIFGWDECKDWERLTLVENTFVSISFRNRIQCSTNFGSSLSDAQIIMISKSDIITVAILWDENTHRAANKAVRKLYDHGVRACYALIPGQPDDHDREKIVEIAERCHQEALKSEKKFIDPWGIARSKYQQDRKERMKVERRT